MLEAVERKLGHGQRRAPDLSDAERESRAGALQHVIDLLIGATIPDHLPAPGAYALDGTAIESWARGRGRRTVDPNADHADDGAADTRPAVDHRDLRDHRERLEHGGHGGHGRVVRRGRGVRLPDEDV